MIDVRQRDVTRSGRPRRVEVLTRVDFQAKWKDPSVTGYTDSDGRQYMMREDRPSDQRFWYTECMLPKSNRERLVEFADIGQRIELVDRKTQERAAMRVYEIDERPRGTTGFVTFILSKW